MTVIELRELAAAKAEEARAIKEQTEAESRGMTQEEAEQFDACLTEAERLEREADRQAKLEAIEARFSKPQERKVKPELADGTRIEAAAGPRLFRYGQLRAFKGPKAEANAYRSGRFLAATIFEHAASRQWCREHGIELRIDTEIDERAMGEGINTAGGFIVPDEFEQSIIDLREEYGSARQNCRIKPMASDHSNEPKKTGGLTAYPVGENQALTESEQGWGNVEMTAKKWAVLTRISTELSEDSLISLADDLASDAALAFATAEDEACIDGDGTSTYHGLSGIRTVMIDGSHTGSYVENPATGDNWSEITDAMLLGLMAALPKYARRGAKWHCSPLAKVAVFDRLISAKGGVTIREATAGVPRPAYMGYPIEEWPAMPTDDSSAALNAKIMLMFGNMPMSSKMGVRRGITLKRLEERYAEYDQIGLRFTERFTINHHTLTGRGGSTTRGPIVGMLGNT
jgi:HK97 family phage major capsid protein